MNPPGKYRPSKATQQTVGVGDYASTPVKIGDLFFPVAWQVSEQIKRHGGVRAAARALGADAAYLSRLRDGKKRDPGTRLLKKLGLRAEVRYVYI